MASNDFNPQVTVVIPTIRPEGANRCIRKLRDDDSYKNFIVLIHMDNERRGCPETLKYLVNKAKTELVMFLGDDTIPLPGMIREAVNELYEFKGFWGMVGLNDHCSNGEKFATHWLASKRLLPMLDGEFFFTGYKHCFCDVELSLRCQAINRYRWARKAKLIHNHPLSNGLPLKDDYAHVYSSQVYSHDQALFQKRLINNWQ